MIRSRLTIRHLAVGLITCCVIASIGCPPQQDETTALNSGEGNTSSSSTGDDDDASDDSGAQAPDSDPSANTNSSDRNGTDSDVGAAVNSNVPGGNERPSQNNNVGESGDSVADHGGETGGDDEEAAYQEPIFEGWEAPQLALFITGRQNGYIEPCGCTGLANQKGGLIRRYSLMKQLRDQGWPVMALDLGNQIRRFGMQPVIKFSRTFEILAQQMGYEAIGLGPDDLRIDAIEIFQTLVNYQKDFNPFVGANVKVLDDMVQPFRVIESDGVKVGVTAVLGDEHLDTVRNADAELVSVKDGLGQVYPDMLKEECDFYVLLAFTSIEECEELAHAYPDFDLIVTAGGDGEPTREPTIVQEGDREVRIIQTGYKGMHVGVVGLWKDGEKKIQYQRVPLDARFKDAQEVKDIFTAYQEQLKTLGLSGLDLRPIAHPSGRTYVGSEACGDCHTTAYDIWENGVDGNGGPHFPATTSLVEPGERTWVQRHHDPECLSCHVTGWNPQKYYPYEGGYLDLDLSAHLTGNGCENCHGPGSEHVEAENYEIDLSNDEIRKRQLAMRVTLEEAKKNLCMECHDLDNSPDFHEEGAWEKYWSEIEHYGID